MFKYLTLLTAGIVLQTAQAAQMIPLSSCEDLATMGANLSAHYYLTQDIDCTGTILVPTPGTFTGTLTGKAEDGSHYTIHHLTIQAARKKNGGLFEKTNHATIDNINVEHATVLSDDNTRRGLLAADMEFTLIENVAISTLIVSGDTTSDSFDEYYLSGREGGLAGNASYSTVINVHISNVQVKQHTWAGGMFGAAYNTEIQESSVSGLSSIWDWQRTEPYPVDMIYGGLVGYGANIVITESSAQGQISAPYNAGGLIGATTGAHITNSYAQMNLYGIHEYAGGLVGRSYLDVTFDHVYAAGVVDAFDHGRGMVGAENKKGDYTSDVTEGYFDKNVTKREYSGDEGSKARSTKRMTKEHNKTFAVDKGWRRDIWVFVDGQYPVLKK